MEIIIQGKPISGSKVSTSGIEPSLVDRIYKDFFEKMGGVRTSHVLIVDTIYWQNSWYSVYTYSRYSGITDTADRQSYFALSIVVPRNFLYLTSGVYHLLQKTYNEKIEGVYLSKAGKYLVSDLADANNFRAIVEYLSREFANSNLEDPIDNGFQKSRASNIPIYNLADCDSIAFLQDLKDNGRVIVGEGDEFPPKCAASVLLGKDRMIENLSAQLASKEGEISQLNINLTDARNTINKNSNSVSSKIKKLEGDIKSLQQEKEQANSQISAKQKELDDLIQNIQALLPTSKKEVVNENGKENHQVKSLLKMITDYLPIMNFVILIVVCISLLFAGHPNPSLDDVEISELKKENSRLMEDNSKKDAKIQALADSIQVLKQKKIEKTTCDTTAMDVDCQLRITTIDNQVINNNTSIKDGTLITVRWQPYQGYEWHTNNLVDDAVKELKLNDTSNKGEVTIVVQRVKQGQSITLNYRTADKNNINKNNSYTLKP